MSTTCWMNNPYWTLKIRVSIHDQWNGPNLRSLHFSLLWMRKRWPGRWYRMSTPKTSFYIMDIYGCSTVICAVHASEALVLFTYVKTLVCFTCNLPQPDSLLPPPFSFFSAYKPLFHGLKLVLAWWLVMALQGKNWNACVVWFICGRHRDVHFNSTLNS